MDIGNKLKTLRTHKKMEPETMAELLKISLNTYRKYERNESSPNLNMLEKIAEIHEINLLDLLSEERLVFNQRNNKVDNNGLVINQLSEKVIELYEKRLDEKDFVIAGKNIIINVQEKIIIELKTRLKNK